MQPGVGAVTPRYDLLGAYHQFERGGFVSDLVLPALDVPGRRGYFGVIPKGVYTAYVSTLRAPKGSPSRSQWTPSSDSYSVKEYSHEMPTDIQEVDEYQGWFDLLALNTMFCAGVVELDIEKTTADLVMNDTTFPADGVTGATVSTAWSTWASATPIQDLITGFNAVRNASGCEPNAFICTVSAFNNITNSAEFRDRAKYVGITPGNATKAQFLSVLGGAMEDAGLVTDNFQVILPWARYNTANPSSTVSTSSIWPTNRAMLTRIRSGPDFMTPQLGRSFRRSPEPEIVTYPEKSKLEVVCATQHKHQKLMTGAPAYMFRGI